MTKTNEAQTYGKMQKQLEKIVAEIADPNLDIDVMIKHVESGYEIIHAMRERLDQSTKKIEELHAKNN